MADHIDHVRKVAGADHVGIGSDFDGMGEGPVGLEDVSKYPDLFAELIRRGWTDADLRKLAGENVLRVMRQAEAVSKRLRAAPAGLDGDHRVAGRRRGRESELGLRELGRDQLVARIDAQPDPVAVGIGDVERRGGALDQRPPGRARAAHPVLEARPPRARGRAPSPGRWPLPLISRSSISTASPAADPDGAHAALFLEASDLGQAQHPGIEGERGHRVGDANRHVMDPDPGRLGHAGESCPKSPAGRRSVMYK